MNEPCEHMDYGFRRRPAAQEEMLTDESWGRAVTAVSQAAKIKHGKDNSKEKNCVTHLTKTKVQEK